jgi:transcriptional regulator with XRE-family HTH domain
MDDAQTLSDYAAGEIRAILARHRITGRDLAAKLHVSRSWVSYRLTGTTEIGLNDLERIAHALDVEVADLLPTPVKREIRYSTQPATRPTPAGRTGDPHRVRTTAKPARPPRAGRPAWTHAGVTR